MTNEEIAEILAKPYAQQLLNGPEPARMAYDGLDGDPRAIPIGFWTDGERILMGTLPKSAKGVPDGYLTAGRKVMTGDQYADWVAGVRGLYDEMAVITITPTWAKLLDFETTLPKAVEDLIKEKSSG